MIGQDEITTDTPHGGTPPHAFFQDVLKHDVEQCRRLFSPLTFPKNASIFSRGDESVSVYLVERGRVRLYRETVDGKEITLSVLRSDELFGEESLFASKPRVVVARCLEETVVGKACSTDVLALLMRTPALATALAKLLSRRFYDITLALESFACMSVRDRLMYHLQRLSFDYGFNSPDGVELQLPMTQADLAFLIGSSRETVSVQIALLKRLGRLRGDGRRLILPLSELRGL